MLAKFHTVEEIEGFQRAVLAAKIERKSANLHINSSASADGRSKSAVELSTVEAQEEFLGDCEAAIASLNPATPTFGGARHYDFSRQRIEA